MIDSLETKEKVRDFEYIWDKVIVPEVERSKKNYSGLFSQDYKLECAIGDCSTHNKSSFPLIYHSFPLLYREK